MTLDLAMSDIDIEKPMERLVIDRRQPLGQRQALTFL
jgi:hypothetical protein